MGTEQINTAAVGPTSGIYEVIHKATGKSYVGQSRDPEWRMNCGHHGGCRGKKVKCHACSALLGSSLPLHNDVRQHGVDAFEWKVLERCYTWDLDDRELYWIAQRVNTRTPTYNLIGTRRHRDPDIFSGKDVDNPYISDRRRKVSKPYRRFTTEELCQLPLLRIMGFTLKQIAGLYGCTPAAVGYALQRTGFSHVHR